MISREQIEALRLPAFYIEGLASGAVSPPLHNAVYARTFAVADGPLERLMGRGWIAAPRGREGPEDLEEEYRERRQSRWWRVSLVPVGTAGAPPSGLFGLCIDVTDAKLRELALTHAAYQDALTGVSNRRRFDLDLADIMEVAAATGQSFSVVVADIDRFKAINDTHGHQAGDAALASVAACMRAALRRDDTVYRIGGDEFAAIIGTAHPAGLSSVVRRIEAAIGRLPALSTGRIAVSVGGTSWMPGLTARDVLGRADRSMYVRKAEGRTILP